jgi:hypothetical protein
MINTRHVPSNCACLNVLPRYTSESCLTLLSPLWLLALVHCLCCCQVHEAMVEAGAYPSPLNYFNFPKSVCTSVNEV